MAAFVVLTPCLCRVQEFGLHGILWLFPVFRVIAIPILWLYHVVVVVQRGLDPVELAPWQLTRHGWAKYAFTNMTI